MIYRHPLAIWFQHTEQYTTQICVVNDLYRYEIFDTTTGQRVAMDSHDTLAQAKAAALTFEQNALAKSIIDKILAERNA